LDILIRILDFFKSLELVFNEINEDKMTRMLSLLTLEKGKHHD
jgi:hypothetical protein